MDFRCIIDDWQLQFHEFFSLKVQISVSLHFYRRSFTIYRLLSPDRLVGRSKSSLGRAGPRMKCRPIRGDVDDSPTQPRRWSLLVLGTQPVQTSNENITMSEQKFQTWKWFTHIYYVKPSNGKSKACEFFHIVSHMGITLTNVGSIINGFYNPRGKKFTDLGLRPRSVNFSSLGCKIHWWSRLHSSMIYCNWQNQNVKLSKTKEC